MARYRDEMSIYRGPAMAARSRPESTGPSRVDADELRARAVRYRRLADDLYDPRVIAEVQACARELEADAARIEKQASFGAWLVIPRCCIGG